MTAAHGDPASQSWGSWVKVAFDYSDQPESWRRSVRVCADAYGEVWRYGTEEEGGGSVRSARPGQSLERGEQGLSISCAARSPAEARQ